MSRKIIGLGQTKCPTSQTDLPLTRTPPVPSAKFPYSGLSNLIITILGLFNYSLFENIVSSRCSKTAETREKELATRKPIC